MVIVHKNQIEALRGFVNRIDFCKLSNKDVRRQLIGLVPQLERRTKEINADIQVIHEKFFSSFSQEELKDYDALTVKANSVRNDDAKKAIEIDLEREQKHPMIAKALVDFSESRNLYLESDIELSVDAINVEDLIDDLSKQGVMINGTILTYLEPIVRF